MRRTIVLFLLSSLSGLLYSLEYDPVNDFYNPDDYIIEVHEIKNLMYDFPFEGAHRKFIEREANKDINLAWERTAQEDLSLVDYGIKYETVGNYTGCMMYPPNSTGPNVTNAYPCDCPDDPWFGYMMNPEEYYLQKKDELAVEHFGYLNSHLHTIVNVKDKNTGKNVASAYFVKSPQDTDKWNKLVLMADGFDPEQSRTAFQVVSNSDDTFSKLFQLSEGSPLYDGNDLCFIDFNKGADDLRKNAKAMLKLIEFANSNATDNLTVGGFSMGGLVSRLSLLYAKKSNLTSLNKVNKFLSIDSPQKGGYGINCDFQNLAMKHTPENKHLIDNDAFKQLMYETIFSQPNANSEFDKFQNFLSNLGDFSDDVFSISIADSDFEKFTDKESETWKAKVAVALPGISSHCFINEEVVFSGKELLPGSHRNIAKEFLIPKQNSNYNGSAVVVNVALSACSVEPTHIPVESAFALADTTPEHLKSAEHLETLVEEGYTPFDKLYTLSKRYEHIDFTAQELIDAICDALALPVPKKSVDMVPVNMLLLD